MDQPGIERLATQQYVQRANNHEPLTGTLDPKRYYVAAFPQLLHDILGRQNGALHTRAAELCCLAVRHDGLRQICTVHAILPE